MWNNLCMSFVKFIPENKTKIKKKVKKNVFEAIHNFGRKFRFFLFVYSCL